MEGREGSGTRSVQAEISLGELMSWQWFGRPRYSFGRGTRSPELLESGGRSGSSVDRDIHLDEVSGRPSYWKVGGASCGSVPMAARLGSSDVVP